MDIGLKIKKLRKERGITQERLAEYLNISPQAVSKWENGTALPDITLVPSISNLFGITLDELFGMSEIRNTEKINAIFSEVHKLEAISKVDEAIELLKNSIKTYPNNYGLISELALALSSKDDIVSINEAISLSEKVLQNSTREKLCSTIRANLCFLYRKTGMNDQALRLAKTLPHIWECREILMPDLVNSNERNDMLNDNINIILSSICSLIDNTSPTGEHFSLGQSNNNVNMKTMLNKIDNFNENGSKTA